MEYANFVLIILSCLFVFFDCLSLRTTLFDSGSYVARMPFAFFSKMSSLNIHLVRLMTWLVILITIKFDASQLYSDYEAVYNFDFNLIFVIKFFLGPDGFATGIFIYVFIVLLVTSLKHLDMEYEVSHPWLENWESNHSQKPKNYGLVFVVMILLNTCFYAYFLSFTYSIISDEIDNDWSENFSSSQTIIYFSFLLGLILFQMIYLIILNHNECFILTSFLWNSWYIFFIVSSIIIKEDVISETMEILLYYLLAMVCIQLAILLILHPLTTINFVFWLIKYGTTIRTFVILTGFSAVLLICISGLLSLHSYNQDLFTLELTWARLLILFGNFVTEIMRVAMGIFSVIDRIISIVTSVIFGLLCWIVVFTLFLTVLVLVFVGFGASVGPEIGKNLARTFEIVAKIAKLLMSMRNVILTIIRYATKAMKVVNQLAKNSGIRLILPIQLTVYIMFITSIPILVTVTLIYLLVVERASTKRSNLLKYIVLVLVFSLLNVLLIVCLDYVLAIRIDLILLIVEFRKGWKFIWMEISYAVLMAGLLILLIYLSISPRARYNIVDDSSDYPMIHETFRFPGCFTCLCPLMDTSKSVTPEKNICAVVCSRISPCDHSIENDEFEKTSTFSSLKRIACPCFYHPEEPGYFKDPISKENHKFNSKRCCKFRQAYNEEKKRSIESDNRVKMLLDIKEKEKAYLTRYISDTGGYSQEQSKMSTFKTFCDFKKFNLWPTYIIPICAAGAAGYLLYLSVTNDWISYESTLQKSFSNLINDESNQVAEGDVNQSDSENKIFCPLTDLAIMLLAFFGAGILSFLNAIFAPFKGLLGVIAALLDLLNFLPFGNIFKLATKIALCLPLIFSVGLVIVGSFILTLTHVVTRIECVYVIILAILWSEIILFLPDILIDIMQRVPFILLEFSKGDGFYYAIYAQELLIFTVVLLVVDHFLPIIPPERSFDMDESVERNERYDVFGLNSYFENYGRSIKSYFSKKEEDVDSDYAENYSIDNIE